MSAWSGDVVPGPHDEHEHGHQRDTPKDPTSPTSPLAHCPPDAWRGEHSRAPEFYGFVAWASTSVFFVVYMLWALLPDKVIVGIGVEWYPSREWAIFVPAYTVVLVLLTYFVYFALALYNTPSFSDIKSITDSRAHLPPPHARNPYFKHADPRAIPEHYDIPIGLVNRVVHEWDQERQSGG
ncbi:PIG-P-domain-containing protein [Coniophora puteana RWD-64-598 SS2]|uniref:PIG-P-domain-containing protein n=1 Tax=Coniophora puteana (strain RWD-64-598) TaxID=741705 RepID=A0A5M3MJ07_CONPW|nr:PIG-P-domain-containing protein [Coniophora puteana RWD-64-598 SS2]EIW78625.1 PIG-P-domain-containing protein [Coniophora puteana RWD-64-598 SS2]